MKKDSIKAIIKVLAVVICLFSINDSIAQRFERRLPHKALKLESIEEETKQSPMKFGLDTKVLDLDSDKSILVQQELIFQKLNQVLVLVRVYKKEGVM